MIPGNYLGLSVLVCGGGKSVSLVGYRDVRGGLDSVIGVSEGIRFADIELDVCVTLIY